MRITYINGIWTNEKDVSSGAGAYFTQAHLAQLLGVQQRFLSQRYTTFDYVYNTTASALVAQYDQEHPCVPTAWRNLGFQTFGTIGNNYAQCLGIRFNQRIVNEDLVRMFEARRLLRDRQPPTDAVVQRLVEHVNRNRNGIGGPSPQHMILVAHSYGNAVVAEAMRVLPSVEQHALNVATGCLASLSLASVANRSWFDTEDPYKLGFILDGDIAWHLNPEGWERISTPQTDSLKARYAPVAGNVLADAYMGITIHAVDKMYLGTPIPRQKIVDLATTLHKECLQGELTLDPSSATVAPGAEFSVRPILKNQNGRRLYGRKYIWSSGVNEAEMLNGTLLPSDSSSFRFRVLTPTPTPRTFIIDTWPYYVLRENLTVSVPTGTMTMGSYVERDTSWYELISANNGGLGDAGIVTPEGDWDGGPTCPTAIRRVYGNTGPSGQAWGDFQLHCRRSYTFSRGQVTDPLLAAQVAGYQWQAVAPGGTPGGFGGGVTLADSFTIDCGGASYCVAWAAVRAVNGSGIPLAISDPIVVSSP